MFHLLDKGFRLNVNPIYVQWIESCSSHTDNLSSITLRKRSFSFDPWYRPCGLSAGDMRSAPCRSCSPGLNTIANCDRLQPNQDLIARVLALTLCDVVKNKCGVIGWRSYKINGYSPYISVMSLRNWAAFIFDNLSIFFFNLCLLIVRIWSTAISAFLFAHLIWSRVLHCGCSFEVKVHTTTVPNSH